MMKATHYIVGDPLQGGFGVIASGSDFETKDLNWLTRWKGDLSDQTRVTAADQNPEGRSVRTLAQVWEYQTAVFGVPVVISTLNVIGSSFNRVHGFSEYILGKTDNAARDAAVDQIIAASNKSCFLNRETFLSIKHKNEYSCPDEIWETERMGLFRPYPVDLDRDWKMALLFRYWMSATKRSFGMKNPDVVHVCLGLQSADEDEDRLRTIDKAQHFFCSVIGRELPRQVQNIASVAAGMNCGDSETMDAALVFDRQIKLPADFSFHIERQNEIPTEYRLNKAQSLFMEEVSALEGKLPPVLDRMFAIYRNLASKPDLTPLQLPFLADGELWYTVFCAEHALSEGHGFLLSAELNRELNKQGEWVEVEDARALFLLRKNLRACLHRHEKEEKWPPVWKEQMLLELDCRLLEAILAGLRGINAKNCIKSVAEMCDFHNQAVHLSPDEGHFRLMQQVLCTDQSIAGKPNYIRSCVKVPFQKKSREAFEAADQRASELMSSFLQAAYPALIDRECDKGETNTTKYIDFLKDDEFLENWCKNAPKTRQAVEDFLRSEMQKDVRRHFLLFSVALRYLPRSEVFVNTMKSLAEGASSPGSMPTEYQLAMAKDAMMGSLVNNVLPPACDAALGAYYAACFRHWGMGMAEIKSGIVEKLGGPISSTLVHVFTEEKDSPETILPDEIKVLLDTLSASPQHSLQPRVKESYLAMLLAVCEKPHKDTDELIYLLTDYIKAFPVPVDTTELLEAVFAKASVGERLQEDAARLALYGELSKNAGGSGERIQRAYKDMLQKQLDASLTGEQIDFAIIPWLGQMQQLAKERFPMDSSEEMRRIFEAARHAKERIAAIQARDVFELLGRDAANLNTSVRNEYTSLLKDKASSADADLRESFHWLNEMVEVSPYTGDEEWLKDRHFQAIEQLVHTEGEDEELLILQDWGKNGQINEKGLSLLQRWCNERLEAGQTQPADMLSPMFTHVDRTLKALENYGSEQVKDRLKNLLIKNDGKDFGNIISSVERDRLKYSLSSRELYEAVREECGNHIKHSFERTRNVDELVQECGKIPEGSFRDLWKEQLTARIEEEQVRLFNECHSMEEALELRERMLAHSTIRPELLTAYDWMEDFGRDLRQLQEMNEYKAIRQMENMLRLNLEKQKACGDVRKTACMCLEKAYPEEKKQLYKLGFRHGVCADLMQAALQADKNLKPNWVELLRRRLSPDALSAACKKPYASDQLPLLQSLLALMDTVDAISHRRVQELYTAMGEYSELVDYQKALNRDRKHYQYYRLYSEPNDEKHILRLKPDSFEGRNEQ